MSSSKKYFAQHDLGFNEILKDLTKRETVNIDDYPNVKEKFIDLLLKEISSYSTTAKDISVVVSEEQDTGNLMLTVNWEDPHIKSYLVDLGISCLESVHEWAKFSCVSKTKGSMSLYILKDENSMRKVYVVYHKDCMDGLAAAAVLFEVERTLWLNWVHTKISFEYVPLQYGKNTDFLLGNKNDLVIFVDFSLEYERMKAIVDRVAGLIVIDHHKTAIEDMVRINSENVNARYIYDVEQCGASLTQLAFKSFFDTYPNVCEHQEYQDKEREKFYAYIRDRDLWLWELPDSKEFSEGLIYKTYEMKNDPRKFNSFIWEYISKVKYKDPGGTSTEIIIQEENLLHKEIIELGKILLLETERKVQSIIKKISKCNKCNIEVNGVKFKIISASDNVSELGNAICQEFHTQAMVYFIVDNEKVVVSMRSMAHLEDVSVVAKSFGGGGHRNACAFEIEIKDLNKFLGLDAWSKFKKRIKRFFYGV